MTTSDDRFNEYSNEPSNESSSPLPPAINSSASVTIDGRDLIICDRDGTVYAYDNACPHTGESLDPMGGSVSTADGALLRCQRHAAEFDAMTGACVSGPCIGEHLTAVAVTVVGSDVYLD